MFSNCTSLISLPNLSEWKTDRLTFYKPGTNNPSLELISGINTALNIYNPTNNTKTLGLDINGLNFYGTSISAPDVTLNANGLTLINGSIRGGIVGQDEFLYLSPQVFVDEYEEYVLSEDTEVDETKVYYIRSGEEGEYIYTEVSEPTGNPQENEYYEIAHAPGTIPIDNYVKDNWRQIIGTKFAVDTEGNLYANNAHLNNAEVEGAITATSLTIGSGSNVYDGEAAINISGYDIVIYEDSTDESIIDHDNTTYLYPVMYHNGEIDETVNNTHYIWYVDDGNIGTIGDAVKGGIVASYGHNYRVTYDFDDGAVGSGTAIQDRLVDPSKYITKISDTGITIHPEDTSNNNYIQLDGTALTIVKNGITIATYGSTITIGANSASRVIIDTNGLTIYKGVDDVAQFGTTARIGKDNNSRFLINSNSLQGYDSSNVKYFEVSANGLIWGNNTAATTTDVAAAALTADNYIKIDGSGIKIQSSSDATDYLYINSDKIAFFRNGIEKMQLTDSSLRLGNQNEAYTTYTNSAIEFYNTSNIKTVSIENGAFKVFESNKPIFRVGTFDSYYQGIVIGDGYLSPTCLSLVGYTNTTPSSTVPMASVGSLRALAGESEYGSSAQLMLSAYSGTNNINHYINIYASSDGWSGIEASTSISINSDERLKENFQLIGNLSDILFTIQPVIYSWKDKRTEQRHLGFKAQDIQQALSVVADDTESFGLVNKNRDGYLNLSYTELIPLLVDVIQKHEKRIIELETQLSGGID